MSKFSDLIKKWEKKIQDANPFEVIAHELEDIRTALPDAVKTAGDVSNKNILAIPGDIIQDIKDIKAMLNDLKPKA